MKKKRGTADDKGRVSWQNYIEEEGGRRGFFERVQINSTCAGYNLQTNEEM